MESVRQDVGEAGWTAQEGLKDVRTVDTAKVRSHLDEVVRCTPVDLPGARWRASAPLSSDLLHVPAL